MCSARNGAAQASGHRARAAPPRWWRPPSRIAQRGERGGKERSDTGGRALFHELVELDDGQQHGQHDQHHDHAHGDDEQGLEDGSQLHGAPLHFG